jgi:hypothetical protein
MSLLDQLLGQMRDNPLGSPVKSRRHAFVWWRYLCYTQECLLWPAQYYDYNKDIFSCGMRPGHTKGPVLNLGTNSTTSLFSPAETINREGWPHRNRCFTGFYLPDSVASYLCIGLSEKSISSTPIGHKNNYPLNKLPPGAESSRVGIIILLTFLAGLGNFSHIVAGSIALFYLIATHSLNWGQNLLRFLLPTLLGSIIGGVSLVAALGHARVLAGN